jgi:SMODS and SLOG-associating 2TM effector domain 1/SMODS and SLOG-associating 2TM effector domain 3
VTDAPSASAAAASATAIGGSMPLIATASDESLSRAQRRYIAVTAVSLVLLIIASIFGIVHSDWAGWASAAAFTVALVLNALGVTRNSRRRWFDGRAAAESGKSLVFKYAVGGDPLGLGVANAPDVLRERLDELRTELDELGADARVAAPADMAALDALRASPREVRADAYRDQRLADQQRWYTTRAGEYRARARLWRAITIALQALGIVGAALKGLGVTDIDWLALAATAAASAAAWVETRDYDVIARSYDFAAHDLGEALERIERESVDEGTWSRFVADAEDAISREHTMWLARRRGTR